MKIGRYNRAIKDFAKESRGDVVDVKILLMLNDVMWMGTDELIYNVASTRTTIITSLIKLKNGGYIKVARTESAPLGLCRMYTITQKGRDLITKFLNILNT